MQQTRPDHPIFDARARPQTVQRLALLNRCQRAAAKVFPNVEINREANRINATRFDGVRR